MSQPLLDTPRSVREGEELDTAKLAAYFEEHIEGASGPVEVWQFPSGYSNLTYLVRQGAHEYVLRRPPFGSKVKSAHDMGREYSVLLALHPLYAPAPKPVLHCDDAAVLGAPFYLMERVHGVILREKRPEGLTVTPELTRGCCERFVGNLVDLHALDYAAAGLGPLRKEGSYVARQVKGWVDRYYKSQTDDIPALDEVATWMQANHPEDCGACLVHNDYKFDNLVLDPEDLTQIRGVLDWEMATIGDPLMELGTVLSYWIEAGDPPAGAIACFLTRSEGAYTRQEVVDRYLALSGRQCDDFRFYAVFGLFKLAVILQQIYYRYKQGLTQDERFGQLIFMVGLLGMKATQVIETGKL